MADVVGVGVGDVGIKTFSDPGFVVGIKVVSKAT